MKDIKINIKGLNGRDYGIDGSFLIKNKGKFSKILGKDWIYNESVQCDVNKQGFRMEPFENINSDYILFLGCSNTVGGGLNVEDTYSYKISKVLKKQYVNLGISGGTNQNILFLLKEILKQKHLPSFIVVNWASLNRTTYYNKDYQINCNPNNVYKCVNWKKSYDELVYNSYQNQQNTLVHIFNDIREHVLLLCELTNIPLYEITNVGSIPDDVCPKFLNYIKYRNVKTGVVEFDIEDINYGIAADLYHPGIEDNDLITNHILSLYGYNKEIGE